MKLLIGRRGAVGVPNESEEEAGQEIYSIFRLIGRNEDALTYALGYLLSTNVDFLVDLLKTCGILPRKKGIRYEKRLEGAEVHLQELRDRSEGGRKDITIEQLHFLRVVIEAKVDGSIPSPRQLAKYSITAGSDGLLDDGFVQSEWGRFENRYLLTLTRSPVPENHYADLKGAVDRAGVRIHILSEQWCNILRLVDRWSSKAMRKVESPEVWSQLLHQLELFLKEDYEVRYFDNEVMHIHVLKNLVYPMCNADPVGYYFDGLLSRSYRECLFFVACYGPARKAAKRAEYIRHIDSHEVLIGADILKRHSTDPMRVAFEQHATEWPGDKTSKHLHVFTLGAKIPIPERKQRFTGPNRGYNDIGFFL